MTNKLPWNVEICYLSKCILISPIPQKDIKGFFVLKSIHFKKQEQELLKEKNLDQSLATGKIKTDLKKGRDRYGLPHAGQFEVKKITPKKVYIEQIA